MSKRVPGAVAVVAMVVVAVGLVAPSPASAAGTLTTHTIVVDGLARTYTKYVPNGLPPTSVPLVVALHGTGSSGSEQATDPTKPQSNWQALADSGKFVVVYPDARPGDGPGLEGGRTRWNDCRSDAGFVDESVDDVAFIDALISQVSSSHNINPLRVYATGVSSGGLMSYRLALEMSDTFAAVAPVVAGMAVDPAGECGDPVHPTSVLIMNGDGDPFVPWTGGCINGDCAGEGSVMSAFDSRNFWIEENATNWMPTILQYPDNPTDDESKVRRQRFTGGSQGTEVTLFWVQNTGDNGAGHAMPSLCCQLGWGEELVAGRQNHDIEGSAKIWELLQIHTLVS